MKKIRTWLHRDGKTTLVAVTYAAVETMLAMPDIYTATARDLGIRAARVLAVTAIGVLARDRKSEPPKTGDGNEPR